MVTDVQFLGLETGFEGLLRISCNGASNFEKGIAERRQWAPKRTGDKPDFAC
jgi:hypothetical protein